MRFQTHNDSPSINTHMSSLQGYIQATRAELEKVFGSAEEWNEQNSDGKIKTRWAIQFADGTVATIYDYCQRKPLLMDEIYGYHIGGHVKDVIVAVHDAFREGHGLLARAA